MTTFRGAASVTPLHAKMNRSGLACFAGNRSFDPSFAVPRLNPAAKFSATNHLATFKGSRKLSLPCKEREKSPQEYLKQVDRVVKITFQEPARVKHIEGSLWRARLTTLPVLSMSATPVCDLRVTFDEALQVLQLRSQQMFVEVHGGPDLDMNFSLQGELGVVESDRCRAPRRERGDEDVHYFEGFVALSLAFNLPFPLSLLPDQTLKVAGDIAMETILGSIERDLSRGIVRDYKSWCCEDEGIVVTKP